MQALRAGAERLRAASPRSAVAGALGALAVVVLLAGMWSSLGRELFLGLTMAGLAVGGIFALSAMGVVLTYKATGVFNFAHGAIAMFVGYLLWQFAVVWSWPVPVAAVLALLVVGPGIGVLLERVVFRPLQVRGASTAEKLVATLGVFVLLVGTATAIWTAETRTDPVRLFPDRALSVGGVRVGIDQLAILGVVVLASLILYFILNHTPLGLDIRAVVDRRELAELAAINANRVSAVAWAMGAGFAGITGVLLAPTTFGLDPFRLTLLVVETFAVAVVARLVSLPLAVVGGLALGLAHAYLTQFSFALPVSWLGGPEALASAFARNLDPLLPSFLVLVLLVALLVQRKLAEIGEGGIGGFVARSTVSTRGRRPAHVAVAAVVAVVAIALPLGLDLGGLRRAQEMVALAVVFLSIVAVTGFSGHITLGQAGFAGFGAFMTGRLHAGTVAGFGELPIIPAMLIAALLCIPLSFLAGYPALRRKGLFLGLTTLALGLVLERFVFTNFQLTAGTLAISRPGLVGDSERAFYYFALVVLALVILLARNLRSGRLGRVLGAMRDSEPAARAIGINLRNQKLFIFAVSAFMAGLGGSLLAQAERTFNPESFITFNSLIWFAVVVVAGITSIAGALLGAFIFSLVGQLLGEAGISVLLIGLLALFLGRLPGGLVGLASRVGGGRLGIPASLVDAYRTAAEPPPRPGELRPSPAGQLILDRVKGAAQ